MAYVYRVLSDDEQHDALVAHLHSLERDLHIHQLNLERYDAMLATMAHEDFLPWSDHQADCAYCLGNRQNGAVASPPTHKHWIAHLRAETAQRLQETQLTLQHLMPQLPAEKHVQAAAERLRGRQARSA